MSSFNRALLLEFIARDEKQRQRWQQVLEVATDERTREEARQTITALDQMIAHTTKLLADAD